MLQLVRTGTIPIGNRWAVLKGASPRTLVELFNLAYSLNPNVEHLLYAWVRADSVGEE